MRLLRLACIAVSSGILMGFIVTNGSYFKARDLSPDFRDPLDLYMPPNEGEDCPKESGDQSLTDIHGAIYCYAGRTSSADGEGWLKLNHNWYGENYTISLRFLKFLKTLDAVEIKHSLVPDGAILLNYLKDSSENGIKYNIFSPNCNDISGYSGVIHPLNDHACMVDTQAVESIIGRSKSVDDGVLERAKFKIIVVDPRLVRKTESDDSSGQQAEFNMDKAKDFLRIQLVRNRAKFYCVNYQIENCEITDSGALVKLSHQEGWHYADGRLAPREVWPW